MCPVLLDNYNPIELNSFFMRDNTIITLQLYKSA